MKDEKPIAQAVTAAATVATGAGSSEQEPPTNPPPASTATATPGEPPIKQSTTSLVSVGEPPASATQEGATVTPASTKELPLATSPNEEEPSQPTPSSPSPIRPLERRLSEADPTHTMASTSKSTQVEPARSSRCASPPVDRQDDHKGSTPGPHGDYFLNLTSLMHPPNAAYSSTPAGDPIRDELDRMDQENQRRKQASASKKTNKK